MFGSCVNNGRAQVYPLVSTHPSYGLSHSDSSIVLWIVQGGGGRPVFGDHGIYKVYRFSYFQNSTFQVDK